MNQALSANDLYLLAPELSLTVLALVVMVVDLFIKRRIVTVTVALVGLIIPVAFAITHALTLNFSVAHHAFFNMLVVDQYALFFQILFLIIAAVMILASYSYVGKYVKGDGEFYTLMLFSATGMTSHDDVNYGTAMNYRGNLTQVQRLVSGTSNYLTTSMTYDMTGQVRTATDSKGNQTTYAYTDNFYDDPGDGSTPTAHSVSTPTNAYLKTITSPTVGSVTLTSTLLVAGPSGK